MLDIELAGETMTLDARRAMFWQRERWLKIADLHLGKASLLRQAGAALPTGSTSRDLERLSSLVDDYRPARLVILGDLTHGAETQDALWLQRLAQWRHERQQLAITLVAGNHDQHMVLPELDIEVVASLHQGPFQFSHAPTKCHDRHVIAGHLHPGARFRDGRLVQRWPAFWIGHRLSVLPAFGSLTGLSPQSAHRADQVFAVTPGGMLAL
ncbi:MAG: ligase-associated DNA damage response endonuclease PdeM [Dokdonella sp.]